MYRQHCRKNPDTKFMPNSLNYYYINFNGCVPKQDLLNFSKTVIVLTCLFKKIIFRNVIPI